MIAGLAAYALSHLECPAAAAVIAYLFLGSALPVQLFLVPLFFLWTQLHLTDSLFGLIVIYWATDAPFATLLLRSFLLKIPKDYAEAARLDGADRPADRPAGRAAAGLAGLPHRRADRRRSGRGTSSSGRSRSSTTRTCGRSSTSFLAFQDQHSTDWGLTSAAAIFMLGPVVLLFLLLQRRFVSGLTAGGIK